MLLDTIASMKTGTYTVTRTGAGTYPTNGRLSAGSTSTFPITAIVQPYQGGRKMLPLPEGVRSEETKHIHTAAALRTRDGGGAQDFITISGEDYHVWAVEGPFTLGGSTHYEVYASRRAKP